jgi:hypothetical protein
MRTVSMATPKGRRLLRSKLGVNQPPLTPGSTGRSAGAIRPRLPIGSSTTLLYRGTYRWRETNWNQVGRGGGGDAFPLAHPARSGTLTVEGARWGFRRNSPPEGTGDGATDGEALLRRGRKSSEARGHTGPTSKKGPGVRALGRPIAPADCCAIGLGDRPVGLRTIRQSTASGSGLDLGLTGRSRSRNQRPGSDALAEKKSRRRDFTSRPALMRPGQQRSPPGDSLIVAGGPVHGRPRDPRAGRPPDPDQLPG